MELFLKNKSDALRTFLSLVGVSVGIFVVTVSFSLVDAFSHSVVAGFDHFGSDMIMVERFPVTGGGDWSRYA
ncbi:MAG: ABC transporter permease, partial [Bacteroidales bacterium]|nr:ABC transporter permease [Bacteroidales bacterium]